jgi:hypothetical protein
LREGGEKCPRCGAIYKKAAALRAEENTPPVGPTEPLSPRKEATWDGDLDKTLEWKLRLGAIPIALGLAALFHASKLGHMLQRTFLTMMVHEVGHAMTAWWCGFAAFPTLWRTLIAETRGPIVPLLLGGGNALLIGWGLRSRKRIVLATGIVSALLQLVGTFGLSRRSAQAIITFGGDGGALVLGTALMATFFFGRETQIYKGWLRWGFVVIGAAAFVDTFATWWSARHDFDAIPFGEIEGIGPSDPSKLTDVYGWTTRAMVGRYVALGSACLLALLALWVIYTRAARATVHSPPSSRP